MAHLLRFTVLLTMVANQVTDRVRQAARTDRGDSPVSTAIIVAAVAVAAVAVAAAVTAAARSYTSKIPGGTP